MYVCTNSIFILREKKKPAVFFSLWENEKMSLFVLNTHIGEFLLCALFFFDNLTWKNWGRSACPKQRQWENAPQRSLCYFFRFNKYFFDCSEVYFESFMKILCALKGWFEDERGRVKTKQSFFTLKTT